MSDDGDEFDLSLGDSSNSEDSSSDNSSSNLDLSSSTEESSTESDQDESSSESNEKQKVTSDGDQGYPESEVSDSSSSEENDSATEPSSSSSSEEKAVKKKRSKKESAKKTVITEKKEYYHPEQGEEVFKVKFVESLQLIVEEIYPNDVNPSILAKAVSNKLLFGSVYVPEIEKKVETVLKRAQMSVKT